jgi:ubiquinone/menaquinone biosynthesis C-methylase UbiE
MSDTHIPLFKSTEYEVVTTLTRDRLPQTIAARTKRVYDVVSSIYPMSTYLFHSRAHRVALEFSGIRDGMRVLEVATGSGEMFRRLVRANPNGRTLGLDLSPRMAARTLRVARRDFPKSRVDCQAVDARFLPFQSASFDAVVSCYLLELLSTDDILLALSEFHRVLRPRGSLTLICIGQNAQLFNQAYKVAGSVAPAFWGSQIEMRMDSMLEATDFRLLQERVVRQTGYPSRVLAARK